nr:MAG TPA: hypothetical protein [Caudoviricetes sp.]
MHHAFQRFNVHVFIRLVCINHNWFFLKFHIFLRMLRKDVQNACFI